MAKPDKDHPLRNAGLAKRVLGPAADEFGKAVQPLGQEIGEVAVQAARALLKPLRGLVWGINRIEDDIYRLVARRLAQVPEDQRAEPNAAVAGPLLDSLRYYEREPLLRELFAGLLTASMDARIAARAHPAFVSIVQQLSSDEARLICYVAGNYHQAYECIYIHRSWEALKPDTTTNEHEWRTAPVFGPYPLAARHAGCEHLTQMPSLLTNLIRLQIISIDRPNKVGFGVPDLFSVEPVIEKVSTDVTNFGDRLASEIAYFEPTPLGEQFFDVCVRHGQTD
jgi:hypothetical protein